VTPSAAPSALRVVFFGTPSFALPTFEALIASTHRVVGVVTQPDRPRGRGQRVTSGPIAELAVRHEVTVRHPERLQDPEFLAWLGDLRADVGVVAAYGRVLPQSVLDAPRLGLLNVHASLLPKYRGAAPVHRAIMAGEETTGVTIMRVVLELDAGPMLAAARRPIDPDETSLDVEPDLAALGAALLMETIDDVAGGRAIETPQDARQATYAPRLTRADGEIDWRRPAAAIHDQVRGLHPWPHASIYLGGMRYILHRTERVPATQPVEADPGTVTEAEGDRLLVAAGHATQLRLLVIQPEGRRPLAARDFLAGYRIRAGARFGAPPANSP